MSVISVPVTFDSATRRKDKSVALRFTSNLEVTTEDYMFMDKLLQQSGWVLFSPNEITSSDIPTEDAPSDTKKPSQRLRAVLYRLWEQNTDKSEPFDYYYQRQMNAIIEQIKERLI